MVAGIVVPKLYLVKTPRTTLDFKKKRTPARRLKHKNTSKHKSTSIPKVQVPHVPPSKPEMVPKARARKDTTPSARRIVDVLIPLLLYILCLARLCDNEIKGAVEI
jgi:hypothetical protein